MPDDELTWAIHAWLAKADGDLEIAEERHLQPWARCYHAQQAIEKAFKAALTLLGLDVARTHDLDALSDALPDDWAVRDTEIDFDRLTEWAVAERYPRRGYDVTPEQANEAARHARTLVLIIRDELSALGFELEA